MFLDVSKLSVRYPGQAQAAVDDVTLGLRAGEIGVLIGPSGCGKTTLLRAVAGLERASAGRIVLGGETVSDGQHHLPAERRRIGMVFQDQKLLFDRSAFENVMLPLSIAGFPPKQAAGRVRAALDKVGLASREKALPVMLSGGEQQRLAIARAVVNRPRLLLADEPTAHLDAQTAADVARIFQEFHDVGVTVLIATYAHELFPLARRLQLDHGRLLA